jgi:hypothetical protein
MTIKIKPIINPIFKKRIMRFNACNPGIPKPNVIFKNIEKDLSIS